MQDVLYARTILAERECPVCGTDRSGRRTRTARTCAACHAPLVAPEAFVLVSATGARLACSFACLRVLEADRTTEGDEVGPCGWCDARWPEAELPRRWCGACSGVLSANVGYVGLVRGGRIRAFCDPACLAAHLARPNPYCG